MAAADDPDLELVRALQAGEESALGELMGRHEEAIFRFFYRYLTNATDAADLTQETFVRVFFRIQQFQPAAKFSVWLTASRSISSAITPAGAPRGTPR